MEQDVNNKNPAPIMGIVYTTARVYVARQEAGKYI